MLKSAPKRAIQGSTTTPHHNGAEDNSMKLRRVASVKGARIVRYQCTCCTPEDAWTAKRIKYSERLK